MSEEIKGGTVLDDRYRLDAKIGEGGMGSVWRGHHLELDAPIAIKLVLAGKSDRAMARFKREAQAAAKLRGQNVVQVFDHGVHAGTPYIVMELLEGESLKDRLERGKPSAAQFLAIFGQMARAVDRAHETGIIHRDLKPGNVQLVPDGDSELVKVLDFGIAKVADTLDEANTKTGALLGTPFYMSPEQLEDSKHVKKSADLWALAVIAFEAIVGTRPYPGDTLGAVAMKIATDRPVPSDFGAVPKDFDRWFSRATARGEGDRFQSAKEMHDALAVALDSEMTDPSLAATVTVGGDDPTVPLEVEEARSALTDRSTATEHGKDWRTWGYPLAALVVGGGVWLVMQKKEEPPPTTKTEQPAITSSTMTVTTAAVTASAAAQKIDAPHVFFCKDLQLDDAPTCEKEESTAWCNRDNKRIACCGKGLVPLTEALVCGCPPGGTNQPAAIDAGCPEKDKTDTQEIQRRVRARMSELSKCYQVALENNPKLKGKVMFHVRVGPDGRVFNMFIKDSSLPDPGAQLCMNKIWQGMQFEPPVNGALSIGYPITFTPD